MSLRPFESASARCVNLTLLDLRAASQGKSEIADLLRLSDSLILNLAIRFAIFVFLRAKHAVDAAKPRHSFSDRDRAGPRLAPDVHRAGRVMGGGGSVLRRHGQRLL